MALRDILRILGLMAALGAAAVPLAHAAAHKPLRILFIGNDLTESGDIPGGVAKLAAALGRVAHVESITAPSYSLEDHWREGRAQSGIEKGWDVVILQQGGSAREPDRSSLLEYTRRFAKPIRAAGAKPAVYMTWPAANRTQDFKGVIAAYRDAALAVDAIVLPVGEAWLRALSADRRLRLYSDLIHPASPGIDLAVMTIYLAIFPAGPREFDEAFAAKIAAALRIPPERRDPLLDAATRAIDEPMALQ